MLAATKESSSFDKTMRRAPYQAVPNPHLDAYATLGIHHCPRFLGRCTWSVWRRKPLGGTHIVRALRGSSNLAAQKLLSDIRGR